jgi:hypothetical protein
MADPPRLSPSQRLAAGMLVVAMAIGSVLLWIGMPVGFVFLGSRVQGGTEPSLGAYALVFVGVAVGALIIGRGLAALDRQFARVTGYDANDRRIPVPWLRSLRGESGPLRRRTILDVVMILSVGIALLALAVWFFGFAHPGVPQA